MNRLLSFFRRKILRIPADRWDYQYRQGEWDELPTEAARLDAIIGLIAAQYANPSILEIGCGKAIMLRQMSSGGFSTFTGIDLSKVAITGARIYETERVRFVHADMHDFVPGNRYDVIAFTESLYYSKDPAAVFARYVPYLKDGGCIIVSAFQNRYTSRLWPSIEKRWLPAFVQQVRDGGNVWDIRMYQMEALSEQQAR